MKKHIMDIAALFLTVIGIVGASWKAVGKPQTKQYTVKNISENNLHHNLNSNIKSYLEYEINTKKNLSFLKYRGVQIINNTAKETTITLYQVCNVCHKANNQLGQLCPRPRSPGKEPNFGD